MNRAPWQNPRIIYTLLFVFLSGAVAGAITMRFGFTPERHISTPSWKEGGREISLQRFRTELNLDEQQSKQIEQVLDDFVMYYQSLQDQMDDVRATGKSRILRILHDDQKQRFEKMLAEMQTKQLR
jgi:hypothetical protein